MLHDKTIFVWFGWTNQQPDIMIKFGHTLLYIEPQILQMIQPITKQTLLFIAIFFEPDTD